MKKLIQYMAALPATFALFFSSNVKAAVLNKKVHQTIQYSGDGTGTCRAENHPGLASEEDRKALSILLDSHTK